MSPLRSRWPSRSWSPTRSLPALIGFAGLRVLGRRTVRRPQGARSRSDGRSGCAGRRSSRAARGSSSSPRSVLLIVSPCPRSTSDSVCRTTAPRAHPRPSARHTTSSRPGFGPGFNGPLTVVLDATGVADAKTAAQTVASDIRCPWGRPVRGAGRVQCHRRHRDPERHPEECPEQRRDGPARRRPQRGRACHRGRHGHQGRCHRPDGHRHRHLAQARRRAAALPAGGRRARVRVADARVPIIARAADRDARVPAERRGDLRSGRGGLPVGLVRQSVRGRATVRRS